MGISKEASEAAWQYVIDKHKKLESNNITSYTPINMKHNNDQHNKKDVEEILKTRDLILENAKRTIKFPPPLVTLDNQSLIYPNTVNIIQGKTGVHKSRLIEVMLAVILGARTEHTKLNLGTTTSNISKNIVIYFDTERNIKFQYPMAIQHIKKLLGLNQDDEINNFHPISLIDRKRSARVNEIEQTVSYFREKYGSDKQIVVVFDVITDIIKNFNDVSESLEFVSYLNKLINKEDVTIFGVIHENPGEGSNKARGHLGTELANKSSTTIQTSLGSKQIENPIIKLQTLKCRNRANIKSIHLKFDEKLKQLVYADEKEIIDANGEKSAKAPLQGIIKYIEDKFLSSDHIYKKELVESLMTIYKTSDRTIEKRLKELLDNNYPLAKGKEQGYMLGVAKGKYNATIYKLIKHE